MAIKYVCRCIKCGKTRESYNDPRLKRSVIECKATCFESHYDWEFVSEYIEEGVSPASPPTLSATVATTSVPAAQQTSPQDQSPQNGKPKVRTAFEDKSASSPATVSSSNNQANSNNKKKQEDGSSGWRCVML